MKQRTRSVIKYLGIAAGITFLLTVTFVAGRSLSGTSVESAGVDQASEEYGRADTLAPEAMGDSAAGSMGGPAAIAEDSGASASQSPQTTATEKLVIRNAGVALQVDDVEESIAKVRALARTYDAEITDLFVDTPSEGPQPLSEAQTGPSNAQITVRVPAAGLDKLLADLAKLGVIVSENSSANDVTEQYVDMEARLKNLRAEEARLRQFFDEAKDVDDLLAVQSELARVRGEIEAMTAQMTYLERQVARATLTISLSERGPIVSPGGTDWGFRQAITDGLRAAVALMTTAVTAIIAISPLLIVIAVVWFVIRSISARRARKRLESPEPESSESL